MKIIYLALIFLIISCKIFAQQLPDVQVLAVLAPKGLKVDGKAGDWNEAFAARNDRTQLFYTLANDDKNLYLIIKSATSSSTNKIMMGGITFVVNSQGKKKEKDGVSITYPLINRANRGQGGRTGNNQNRQAGQGGFQNRSQQNSQQRDSILMITRKAQLATVKEIKISGVKTIQDSLISIYNEYGVKAVANINTTGDYIYELSIPLSLLELNANQEFAYQIKVNGMSNISLGANGSFGGGNFGGGRQNAGGNGGGKTFQDLMSATDFWGKYTLAKP